MTGRTGKLFVEFALTLAGAVIVSGFVALTLSPMMCSLLLTHEKRHGKAYLAIEASCTGDRRLPARAHGRAQAALDGDAGLRAGRRCRGAAARALKSELAPVEDRGVILGVFLGPGGGDARLHRQVRAAARSASTPDLPTSSATSSSPATRRSARASPSSA
jgi:multidrug efflux pump